MASILDKLTDAEALTFIDRVAEPFKTLPHLPKGITEFLVTISPWLILLYLVGEVFVIFGSLASLVVDPVFGVVRLVTAFVLAFLLLSAFSPVKNREIKGWVYLFWIELIGVVEILINAVSGRYSSMVGTVIGLLIGLYILFEMRSFFGLVLAATKKAKEILK